MSIITACWTRLNWPVRVVENY